MMDLDEAIQHCEEVAEKNERRVESVRNRPISSADFYHEEESCSKCAEEHRKLAEWLKELKAYKENTCGDAISRQAVLDCLKKWQPYMATRLFDFEKELSTLPSITPQQRMGRWVKEGQGGRYKWMCSNCGTHHRALYDYCPSCGCKMEAEE